jgi:Leucine-rich repeat (LRR) protein
MKKKTIFLILSFHRKLFSNLKYLKKLDLSHNEIAIINFATNIGVSNSLEVLELSHNKIFKFIGNMTCSNLSRLELSSNNLKRFFVDQFWSFSRQKLTVNLIQNSLESVDFRDLSFSFSSNASLLINVDDEIICNCHTMSLYNFTRQRLRISSEIYSKIKVFPEKIKCIKQSSETPSAVLDIQTKSITCPLDFPHQIFCPLFCNCLRRPFDGFLIMRCANISTVPTLPHFKMLKDIRLDRIELDIAGNGVNELPSKLKDVNYASVTKIHASHNNIQLITVFNIPDMLEFLDLKHNRLSHISADVVAKFTKLHFLHLSNNPWNCETAKDLVRFVKRYRNIEKDFNMVQCSSYQYFLEIETEEQCNGEILMTVLVFIGLISITVSLIACYMKREMIIEWIFIKDKLHLLERTIDKIKLFDAIICVCEHDKIFGKYIAAKLVERPNQYKIGIILKDWAANDPIPNDVLKGIHNARRVIIILSEYFEVIELFYDKKLI